MSIRIVDWASAGVEERRAALARTTASYDDAREIVAEVFNAVAARGDDAVREYSARFDGSANLDPIPQSLIDRAAGELSPELRKAIDLAFANITAFHRPQVPVEYRISRVEGVECWRAWTPIRRVGLYVPGGSAPLFSTLLMLGVPARLAGCSELVVCTPPMKDGAIAASIRYAATILGITELRPIGGAQAIAAMAIGTISIPRVDKIFGPGNRFVAEAKNRASAEPYTVPIDIQAGPTELLMIADETMPAAWIAADLIAQAEHGPDSHVVVVTDSLIHARAAALELDRQLAGLPRAGIARTAIEHSAIIVVQDMKRAIDIANEYAPEHLNIAVADPGTLLPLIRNAGSVFVGPFATAVFGDYISGTNHTLPTAGAARYGGGVTVESFMKPIFFQAIDGKGYAAISTGAAMMARAEQLEGHARSVEARRP